MCWYYLINGIALCGVAFTFEKNERFRSYFHIVYFPSVLCALAIFVGLRSSGPDYGSYLAQFDTISIRGLVAADWVKDPAFVLVNYIMSMFKGGFVGVALVFAITALASQFVFIRTVSDRKWITLFFYLVVCRTLIGSDMASIRSAVAIPLMSIGIVMAFRGKRRLGLFLYIAALAFHLAVLIGLFPFVLSMWKVRFSSRWWILSVAFVTVLMKVFLENIAILLLFVSRVSPYIANSEQGTPSTYYVYIMARILFLVLIVMFYWDTISSESRMMLFCYSIGICLQITFIFNNALSWRSSDIFAMFDIAILMIPLKLMKGYYCGLYAAWLVAFGLVLFQFSIKIMEPYRWVLA